MSVLRRNYIALGRITASTWWAWLTAGCWRAVHYSCLVTASASLVVVLSGGARGDVMLVVVDAVAVVITICVRRRDVAARVAALVRERRPLPAAAVFPSCSKSACFLLTTLRTTIRRRYWPKSCQQNPRPSTDHSHKTIDCATVNVRHTTSEDVEIPGQPASSTAVTQRTLEY